jgi:hypothetical protein
MLFSPDEMSFPLAEKLIPSPEEVFLGACSSKPNRFVSVALAAGGPVLDSSPPPSSSGKPDRRRPYQRDPT